MLLNIGYVFSIYFICPLSQYLGKPKNRGDSMRLPLKMKPKSHCHGSGTEDIEELQKIVLAGAPNVGKSMVFNRLTGTHVTVSNYPGTTVEIDKGKCKINGKEMGLIDCRACTL